MRLQTSTSTLILDAAISNSATAFAPSALAPRQATRLDAGKDAEEKKNGTPMLHGVDLPSPADIPEVINWPFTQQRVQLQLLLGAGAGTAKVMLGQPKRALPLWDRPCVSSPKRLLRRFLMPASTSSLAMAITLRIFSISSKRTHSWPQL